MQSNNSGEHTIPGLGIKCKLVNDEDSLDSMLNTLLPNTAMINVDLEGIDLSREGQVCLMQIHGANTDRVYIIDFIGFNPFTTLNGRLKTLLETTAVTKVFFDPRNDAAALSHQFNVHLKNVICLQLAEVADCRS